MKLFFLLLLIPISSIGQTDLPKFENDTLYTTSGFKMYKGQTLHLGNGTDKNGCFRFIKFNLRLGQFNTSVLQNTSLVIKKLKGYTITGLGNRYIGIIGTVSYKDGSKGGIDITMNFDKAIQNFPALPSELIIPDEFKSKPKDKDSISEEIQKLYKLYQDSILTKEEFESQKKKLLE